MFVNKNDKQLFFNQVKGTIEELNNGDKFCSITLKLGHENPRFVNLSIKKPQYDIALRSNKIGDKVAVKFYLSSRNKNNRWYTVANVLEISQDNQ